jgi:hypothetical protein
VNAHLRRTSRAHLHSDETLGNDQTFFIDSTESFPSFAILQPDAFQSSFNIGRLAAKALANLNFSHRRRIFSEETRRDVYKACNLNP